MYLFNIIAETAIKKALDGFNGGIVIVRRMWSNLRYADDIIVARHCGGIAGVGDLVGTSKQQSWIEDKQ